MKILNRFLKFINWYLVISTLIIMTLIELKTPYSYAIIIIIIIILFLIKYKRKILEDDEENEHEINREEIENLLNLDDIYIKSLYNTWDKSDCSIIGLTRILMIQEIKKEITIREDYYDGQYDDILNDLLNHYNT